MGDDFEMMCPMRYSTAHCWAMTAVTGLLLVGCWMHWPHSGPRVLAAPPLEDTPRDPAAWGSDHVDRELPEYMEQGECLFCHRHDVGGSWATDRHATTIYDIAQEDPALEALKRDPATAPFVPQVQLLMGDARQNCFLRRGTAYGTVDLLSARANYGRGSRPRLSGADDVHWDTELFAQRCAGCHATAVDQQTLAFTTVGHECFVCHGDADQAHTTDGALMTLSPQRHDSPEVVISICAQCHVRFGESRSTGRPYATHFVPGDNLFRDFAVDFSQADNPELNPIDRHVMANVRDVALLGSEMTCLTCHEVHGNSTARHTKLADSTYCAVCHDPQRPKTEHLPYEVHSPLCGY